LARTRSQSTISAFVEMCMAQHLSLSPDKKLSLRFVDRCDRLSPGFRHSDLAARR
jgi:hypothetical protein